MNINEFADEKGIEARSARALTEVMSVCDFDDVDGYTVVSSSGGEYTTTLTDCDCPDATHRDALCKHSCRLAFELGEAVVPATIDADDVDDQLGEHLENADVRFAADLEDGALQFASRELEEKNGELLAVATDGGEILEDEESDDGRPDECECEPWMADLEDPLPCWECYRAGFEVPTPGGEGRMMTIDERLEDVLTEVVVAEGRLEMSAGGDADVVIHTEDITPLTAGEVHASIRIHGDDYSASIDLDGALHGVFAHSGIEKRRRWLETLLVFGPWAAVRGREQPEFSVQSPLS